jgi:hypothetical protein
MSQITKVREGPRTILPHSPGLHELRHLSLKIVGLLLQPFQPFAGFISLCLNHVCRSIAKERLGLLFTDIYYFSTFPIVLSN